MKILTTQPFEDDYAALPATIQDIADRKLALFLANPRHASLHVKKMNDPRDIGEGRITKGYRFTFQIAGDTYLLRRIGTRDILRKP
jgi:hypothetical protein